MITLLGIFALGCLLPLGDGRTEHIPAPGNVSLAWVTVFCYKMSWSPVVVDEKPCMYKLSGVDPELIQEATYTYKYTAMNGWGLRVSLATRCPNVSAQVHRNITYPELVQDFQCALHSESSMSCSWRPARHTADLGLYYWEGKNNDYTPDDNCTSAMVLKECPEYRSDTTGTRTGCSLEGDFLLSRFFFLFNGTVNGVEARNTFHKTAAENMQLPALNWTGIVDKVHNKLTITWTGVDLGFKGHWKYILSFTKCGGKAKHQEYSYDQNSTELPLDSCQYNISMRAEKNESEHYGQTAPGNHQLFGENTNPHTKVILASVLIPAALVVVLLVAMVCFRRHRETLLPRVPAPAMPLTTNGSISHSLYVPALEEEPEDITLEIRRESR